MAPEAKLGMRRTLWQFAQGSMSGSEFKSYLYAHAEHPNLAAEVGEGLLLDLLWVRYEDNAQLWVARDAIRDRLITTQMFVCSCERLGDRVTATWIEGSRIYDNWTVIARQTPWIECVGCRHCGQAWYVGTDTDRDEFHFMRLRDAEMEAIRHGTWPTAFAKLSALWPDADWLSQKGCASLEAWQAAQPPIGDRGKS